MSTTIESHKTLEQQQKRLGLKRSVQQVYDIGTFEFIRSFKKTLILLGVALVMFIMFFIIEEAPLRRGEELSEDPYPYFINFLGMISMIILICATAYGGSLLVIDFEKQTGNILFPKISRNKMFFGRFLANYIMNGGIVIFYYLLVAFATLYHYQFVPSSLWASMGWALLYTLAVLSFITFFSSFMKSTAMVVVFSLIFLLILFSIIESILSLFTTVEPLFLLTYYSRIITQCFNMPLEDERVSTIPLITGEETGLDTDFAMTLWSTPSHQGALFGMLIYSAVFIFFSFVFFRRRELK
ncbi:hypothetical protein NEF87_000543 [Candidatus Lokiarchaeum ossiferum]|uniref:ABC transporter permease n=1 Tax=Candidatus Lokiarchaeum ossiferum TaxID=2951803 RepID=A0ABY6HL75_9ARCH|nr:hypothetical protein NEF87_000543 [Candidatus Lokiarchaeum sp. B-35]